MPFELSLIDLVSPYVMQGDTFGPWHAILSTLRVADYEIASDENGLNIRGVVEFEGNLAIDPSAMSISFDNQENHPEKDASRRDPWIDVRDSRLEFQLLVPRVPSQKVIAAVGAIGANPNLAPTLQVLNAYDTNVVDAPPSDYPSTTFTLDLLLTSIVLRPPFLRGARREANGQLVPDLQHEKVTFTLPRLKFRISQLDGQNDRLTATLLSLGASGLDDPGDLAVAELIKMDPPYAFIGRSQVVGFGFRSGILDLSNGSTPPDVLSQFGFDESWTGLYLPEIRLFVAPDGAEDLAIDAGVENLLIGIGASSGVTGDFSLQVLDQGAGALKLSARFYDAQQKGFGIVRAGDTATVALPVLSRMVVDVDGGRTPIETTVVCGLTSLGNVREADIDLSDKTTMLIKITAKDTSSPPRTANLTITASRRAAPTQEPGIPLVGPVPAPELIGATTTQSGVVVQQPRLEIGSVNGNSVAVQLKDFTGDATQIQWTKNGTPAGNGPALVIDLAPGAPDVAIKAEIPGQAGVSNFTAYYHFDLPPATINGQPQSEAQTRQFALDANNTHTTESVDEGPDNGWIGGEDVAPQLLPKLKSLNDNSDITIEGFASYEGPTPPPVDTSKRDYNAALARRRALGLRAIIEDLIAKNGLSARNIKVVEHKANMANWPNQGFPDVATRRIWWKAVAHWPPASAPGTVSTGTLHRDPQTITPQPGKVIDPAPPANQQPAPPPRWFRQMGAKVRIVRDQFVACEITAKLDIQTAAEDRLQAGMPPNHSGSLPAGQPLAANPADGLIDFRLVIQIDDSTGSVSIIGYYGADPADIDGLMLWGTRPGLIPSTEPGFGQNFMGLTIVFMPLISAGVGSVASDGALAELAMTSAMLGIPAAIAALNEASSNIKIRCERIIWYGGEMQFRQRPDGTEAALLFDLEAALSLDVSIGGKLLIKIKREDPLCVRYKAVGIRLGDDPNQPRFQFRPVFDASKGYTIDVSKPGAITVASPLDKILTILGARIARNNPLVFEIDLGFAVDLGVVTIERARIRMQFDPVSPPELTAFAASINIPGAISAHGYLELNEKEIKGQLDLTIVPVQIRVAAGLGIASINENGRQATGVIVALEVEFPVGIPLANSGLGIYGFLGLFAMHYGRKEPAPTNMAPALVWLKDIAQGNPTNIAAWEPKLDRWAFGVGAILGTMGTKFILNLKGVVLLELPGPRLLLMMKAKFLADAPGLKSQQEGTILAVIDLDMGRGTLTIGLSVTFEIKPLLEIRIPVEAFFDFNSSKNWYLYIGRYVDQIHAKIFEVFEGSGYAMISGKNFESTDIAPGLPAPVQGFAISAGLHVAIVWGSKSIGLYAEVAAGFDAVLGFEPFLLAGTIYVRGTLHLFIIEISAWANLNVAIGELPDENHTRVSRVWGDICGKVEFLFFEVEGCVHFEFGSNSTPTAAPPKLFQGLKLVSRSPALAEGTGVDKPIDASIAEGIESPSQPAPPPPPPPPPPPGVVAEPIPLNQRRVPIDAIPLVMLAMPPVVGSTQYKFRGQPIVNPQPGTPGAPSDGWVQRGEDVYRYDLKSVTLIGDLTVGHTPIVWWPQKAGNDNKAAQLALLSYTPDPTPKALIRNDYLEESFEETWGTVCNRAAPPAPVFFSFLREALGPSEVGWLLDGVAWPDPPNTIRSSAPDLTLTVSERWRTGQSSIDNLLGIIPAEVEGAPVSCPRPSNNQPPRQPRVFNPVAAARGTKRPDAVTSQEFTLLELISRANSGQEVTRGMLSKLTVQPRNFEQDQRKCSSRVLASPLLDGREPAPFGNTEMIRQAFKARDALGYRAGPYDDTILVHTGPLEDISLYLFVQRSVLASKLVRVGVTTADDVVLAEQTIDGSFIATPADLPDRWLQSDGPWHGDVQFLTQHQTALQSRGYIGVLVRLPGDSEADRVQIGIVPQEFGQENEPLVRPFYLAAVEVTSLAEVIRSDYDNKEQTRKQKVLEAALSASSSDKALLKPDTAYAIEIKYDVKHGKRPPGKPLSEDLVKTGLTQKFWFFTDATPPARLDPWILCCAPQDGEQHYFGGIPLRLSFNTPDVGRIYAAYGKELRVRIRAASFRPLPTIPNVPHPFPLDEVRLKPVVAALLAPWEAVAVDRLSNSCVPVDFSRSGHSTATIPIPLEPLTDYELQIEMVSVGAASNATGPVVYRSNFSTGRFENVEQFATAFRTTRIVDRFVAPNKLQAIGQMFALSPPQGAELDVALGTAGLEPMPVATSPRIIVFWQNMPAGPPQPAAVLIDSSEPLVRFRNLPVAESDPHPPHSTAYVMRPVKWLTLEAAPGAASKVDKIIFAPGGQRALVTLQANARGTSLKLLLRSIALTAPYLDGPSAVDGVTPILDTILARAPWEETD